MGRKSRDKKEIKTRTEIAQKLGYHIMSIQNEERQLAIEWFREAGQEEDAKEAEEDGRKMAQVERPSKEELEAWFKECDARGVAPGAGGKRKDEDYRILRLRLRT